jgi:hypothetical protein
MKKLLLIILLLFLLFGCKRERFTCKARIEIKSKEKIYYSVLRDDYRYLFWEYKWNSWYGILSYMEEGDEFYIDFEYRWASQSFWGNYTPVKLIQDNLILYEQ